MHSTISKSILFTQAKTVFLHPYRQSLNLMKTTRFPIFLLLTLFSGLAIITACKEKNQDYPPHTWSEYSYTNSGIGLRDISVIFYESDHSSWLGAKGNEGLLYFDGYNWTAFDKSNTGIDFDSLTSMSRDGIGNLWVGWKSGLATFDGNTWKQISLFNGLCVTSIVVEGISDIRVGVKGESGGSALYQNSQWTFYTPANSEIPSANINAMTSDHNQVLWLATADKGIVRLRNGLWESMSNSLSLISQNFTSITLSKDGSIWAGSMSGQLIHFYNDTALVLNTGTSKPISSILIADDNKTWCGTLGAGLINFDGQTWTSFTAENDAELPSDDILYLTKSDPGLMLFSIPGGKVLLNKQ